MFAWDLSSGGHITWSVICRLPAAPQQLGDQEVPRVCTGRILQGEMALVSVEGCPKRQQREEEQQGQSLAVGKDLCHGMMFSPIGFA